MTDPKIIRPNAGFIIPERRFVDVSMPVSAVGASGRYMIVKRNAQGDEIERTPWFDNIILDAGLNRWGTDSIISGAAIGTGTSTPAATDTGLQTQFYWTTATGVGAGITAGISPNYNNTRTFVYRTALGALDGNYSEVGVGWASGSMFSRALILDGGGAPTAISVLSSEQLDIFYQLSVYPPLVDIGPTTITISGVNYDVTGRALAVTDTSGFGGSQGWSVSASSIVLSTSDVSNRLYNNVMGAITASTPTGTTSGGTSSATSNAYSASSYTRTGFHSFSLLQGNESGGVKSSVACWTSTFSFQYQFNPVIPKDGTKTLVLNYSVTWARRP